jgi:DNA-binding transcriptional LysR family regulator
VQEPVRGILASVNLSALDLNLLVVLDALLAEKSVSGAARRLNSTQPAVSRSLGRLRTWFGDPLLTRTRKGMAPTAMGLVLGAEVREVVHRIEAFVDRRESFEPGSARRAFHLTMTDFPQQVICGPLLAHLARHAPGIDVDVRPWSLDFPEGLEAGTLDAAISPPINAVAGLRTAELVSDELVLIVRRHHPVTERKELTLDDYCTLAHVQSAPNGRAGSVVDDMLSARGVSRRVVLRLPSTLALPALVAGSDCCATVPRRLAESLSASGALTILPLPFEAPGVSLTLVWHDRSQHDPGHAWLRAALASVFAPSRVPRQPGGVGVLDLKRRASRTL